MSQPARWLWGLIPLALLWGSGNLLLGQRVERDVARRAEAAVEAEAGSTPGARPAFAQVVGRDVTISGEVLSADGASKAMARLRSEPGIRRVLGGLSQVVAQKPYSWFASRQADAITLGGFVPDAATAEANVAAAREAVPGIRVEDRQSPAFGAPDGFAATAKGLIAALPRLEVARVSLDDRRFCIEGTAASPDDFLALTAGQAAPGFSAVACDLRPPTIAPYRWSLERSAAGAATIAGFYPDRETREKLAAAVRSSFPPPAAVTDETKPGAGAPAALLEKAERAARDLARLSQGRAAIEGELYTLSGKGPDQYAACEALKVQIAQQDGPDSVARVAIDCPPAPPPDPVMPPLPEVPGLILDDVLPSAQPVEPAKPPLPEVPALILNDARPDPPPSPASPTTTQGAAVAPAPVEPWSAELLEGRLVLKGAVADEAARAAILAAVERLFPGRAVEDGMVFAPVSVAGTAAPALYALTALSKLQAGRVEVREGALSIAGQAADAATWQALREALAAPPEGLKLASTAEAVPVRPYELALSADRSGVRISGSLPDEAARAALRAAVADSPLAGKLDDEAVLAPGAPAGFTEASKAVLADLLRLDIGSATIRDGQVTIRGLTCRELIASEVQTSERTSLPAGFTASVTVSPRQTGCVLDPPASCQNDLDGLTKQNPVLFAQGTAAVTLDPTTERVIAAATAILQKCPGSQVTIEGHANRDGEWRGFDNRELSLRRAQRVRDELARRGIDPASLAVKGYGVTRPLLPHGAPQAREMNRRVQFTIAK